MPNKTYHLEGTSSPSAVTKMLEVFLEKKKLLAKYDHILESHLKFAAENPRSVNYLSNNIQNEFIHIVASEVRRVLIEEIKESSKYYGMMYDETPDSKKRANVTSFALRPYRLGHENC